MRNLFISALCLMYPLCQAHATQDTSQKEHIEEIRVTSRGLGEGTSDIARSIKVLASEALDRSRSLTLGDTLDKIPGLSQASFGPAVSRPVIRGLGGDRIRILTNGIGTIDASSTSPDHGLAVDINQAEQIEIFRGPATLLFGSNAVGGAINVFDGRIPIRKPRNSYKANASAYYGTNSDERAVSSGTTFHAGKALVLHADGSYSKRGDLDIPGSALSSSLLGNINQSDLDTLDIPRGSVPNTGSEKYNVSLGGSVFFDKGFIGSSVTYFDNVYGLPPSFNLSAINNINAGGEPDSSEEENVTIAQEQIRFDLIGELEQDILFFDKIKFRGGYGDYKHVELEGDEIGTRFLNEGIEARLELTHDEENGLSGIFGAHFRSRDFAAIGEEAFVPESKTEQSALFLIEKYDLGTLALEFGGRIEHQTVRSSPLSFEQKTTNFSLSSSAIWHFSNSWQFALNGFRTERSPNAEELLSNGPHLATRTFELGNNNLNKETAAGFEARLERTAGIITGSLTYFYTDYDDFIFQVFTGDEREGLAVSRYQGTDAKFEGIESEVKFAAYQDQSSSLTLGFAADYVKATDTRNGQPLPRIPPLSLSGEVLVQTTFIDWQIGLTFADDQNRTGAFERPTDDYYNLETTITYHPTGPQGIINLYLKGKNLLDQDIRFATSFLKDTLPSGGLSVIFGISAKL